MTEHTDDGNDVDAVREAGSRSAQSAERTSGAGLEGSTSGAGELIRDALVDDDDPRFPIWLPIPGIVLAGGWAFYAAAAAGGSFLPTLLWPGVAIFLGGTLATWLGWQLDID